MNSNRLMTLYNGMEMPSIGFGTYRIKDGDIIFRVVDEALNAGYRLFDTAAVYGNEQHLNQAFTKLLPKYNLTRKDIFITTKLAPTAHGGGDITEHAFRESLDTLGSGYVDLYLVHFPGVARLHGCDPRNAEIRSNSWAKLVELHDAGYARSIGVSNYTIRHLEMLLSDNHGVPPAVNQVEFHPYYNQYDLLQYCNINNVVLQAYCSMGGTSCHNNNLLEDPVVETIAKKLNVTRPQLLLAWALQLGAAVIPKSTDPIHIRENIQLDFDIPSSDIDALNSLRHVNMKYAWDPSNIY